MPTSSIAARRLWLGLVLLTSACADDLPDVAAAPLALDCACPAGECPVDVCDLQIEVSNASCASEVQAVEVLLGDRLEPATFLPGQPRRTCTTWKRGTTLALQARADRVWQWAETITCPVKAPGETRGPTIARLLNCKAP